MFADGQECGAPEETLKGLISFLLPLPLYSAKRIPVPGTPLCGGWGDRKEGGWWGLGGGGTPAERTRGAQGTFQSSSSPEVPPFFRCSRLDFSAGRPTWIPRLGTQPESKRHSRPIVGAHCLPHPPSFLSSTTLHPWYRSLLWLQGYDTSPGHHGLKE